MKRCRWKKDKFNPCNNFEPTIVLNSTPKESGNIIVCKSCTVVIQKPEEELIIIKSGETWVAKYKGNDYFYNNSKANHHSYHYVKDEFEYELSKILKHDNSCNWTLLTKIELTDEVAKLRPKVINNHGFIGTLVFVSKEDRDVEPTHVVYRNNFALAKWYSRLASVDDLKEE